MVQVDHSHAGVGGGRAGYMADESFHWTADRWCCGSHPRHDCAAHSDNVVVPLARDAKDVGACASRSGGDEIHARDGAMHRGTAACKGPRDRVVKALKMVPPPGKRALSAGRLGGKIY